MWTFFNQVNFNFLENIYNSVFNSWVSTLGPQQTSASKCLPLNQTDVIMLPFFGTLAHCTSSCGKAKTRATITNSILGPSPAGTMPNIVLPEWLAIMLAFKVNAFRCLLIYFHFIFH